MRAPKCLPLPEHLSELDQTNLEDSFSAELLIIPFHVQEHHLATK